MLQIPEAEQSAARGGAGEGDERDAVEDRGENQGHRVSATGEHPGAALHQLLPRLFDRKGNLVWYLT